MGLYKRWGVPPALLPDPGANYVRQRFSIQQHFSRGNAASHLDCRAARKVMIVALARKLLIALWRMVTIGEMPEGVTMRAA